MCSFPAKGRIRLEGPGRLEVRHASQSCSALEPSYHVCTCIKNYHLLVLSCAKLVLAPSPSVLQSLTPLLKLTNKDSLNYLPGLRRNFLLMTITLWTIVMLTLNSHLSKVASSAFLPPQPSDQDLTHFIRSRSLEYYLDNM